MDKILSEYDQNALLYEALARHISTLLEEKMGDNGVYIHSIHYRVKTRASLSRKLNKPDTSYKTLGDLTDIAGVRVITYFSLDVEQVANIVQREFVVEDSVDKGDLLDPDRFGYLSLHYIVRLYPSHANPAEYKRLVHLKAEIQIRTILQHAWAEIEHDLGYKSKHAIPIQMRRRFSWLSGLLELADYEFNGLREELRAYTEEVTATHTMNRSIDKISLTHFIKRNDLVVILDETIQNQTGFELVFEDWFVDSLVDKLVFVGVSDLSTLEVELKCRFDVIKRFAIDHLIGRAHSRIHRGVSIYYFCTGLLAESGNENRVQEYLTTFDLGIPDNRKQFALRIIEKYKNAGNDDTATTSLT